MEWFLCDFYLFLYSLWVFDEDILVQWDKYGDSFLTECILLQMTNSVFELSNAVEKLKLIVWGGTK